MVMPPNDCLTYGLILFVEISQAKIRCFDEIQTPECHLQQRLTG